MNVLVSRLLTTAVLVVGGILLILPAQPLVAQGPPLGVYQPLNPLTEPGLAGRWRREFSPEPDQDVWFQPMRFRLPTAGIITVYDGSVEKTLSVKAPAQIGLLVGRTYRIRISGLPELPGIELYPSIEVLDRLHPPPGHEQDFPIPIDFTREEIQAALEGQLITRVVYLEQPQLAAPVEIKGTLPVRVVSPHRNLLAEADRLGRPMAVVRLGGRTPAGPQDRAFFGECPPVAPPPPASRTEARRRSYPPDAPLRYPEEYLLDGGDRDVPIHYGPFHRLGVDTEDTIAEYVDHTGDRHVKATNRVAIYAPRFAALRTACVVGAGTAVAHLASARVLERNSGLSARRVPTLSQEHLPLGAVRVRSRASGLEMERLPVTVANELRLAGHTKLLNAFEDIAFLWTGQFARTNEARLAYCVAAAFRWSRAEYPVITATDRSSHEVSSRFKPEVLIGISEEHKRKGDLRIVKLADKKVAQPGDVVTFTIRYDNLGDRTLYHVRIVDNLTPRLAFLEDSATSDRPGDVKITDNEEGSVVLEFQLDDPLPGHTGGVITFQARVR